MAHAEHICCVHFGSLSSLFKHRLACLLCILLSFCCTTFVLNTLYKVLGVQTNIVCKLTLRSNFCFVTTKYAVITAWKCLGSNLNLYLQTSFLICRYQNISVTFVYQGHQVSVKVTGTKACVSCLPSSERQSRYILNLQRHKICCTYTSVWCTSSRRYKTTKPPIGIVFMFYETFPVSDGQNTDILYVLFTVPNTTCQ